MTIDKKELAGLTKKERRELQREMTRIKREAERKRRKRNKILGISGLVLLVVALLAAIALVVWTNLRIAHEGPKNMLSDGLVLTGDGQSVTPVSTAARQWGQAPVPTPAPAKGVVDLTLYVDYGSTDAASFDTANMQQLQQWLTYGYIQLEVHPIALDGYDAKTDNYSSLAANAAACVADVAPSSFLAANTALLDANPAVTDKPIDAAGVITALTPALGGANTDVSKCVTDGRFDDWVADASQKAANGPLPGTKVDAVATAPLVLVNGEKFTGDITKPTDLITFISQMLSSDESTGTDASSPTPSATPAPTETPVK
ncbi:Thioredoxin [Paramicrobacterium humi]|uniref:Thioredoxin n=1 Tax=Paramicrobacterium humi TaxID=640635 RepID=A0A1H4JY31_9MICO|nr:thioredoxin domain-containing protein [Microbacterium humi]SEB51200.1 Thioredoxin [Microbacterium humi]